eukprot:Clim_evm35s109 gene=Clim_evmTU35s109
MSTSVKHRNFTTERMGDKPIDQLPGIGEANKKKLEKEGITKCYHVLSMYLGLDKNSEAFIDSMVKDYELGQKYAKDAEQGIAVWCENFL